MATNLVYENSQIPLRMRVIGFYRAATSHPGHGPQVGIPPVVNNDAVLAALMDTNDNVLDDVSDERDRLGADIVIFFGDEGDAWGACCGEATGYVAIDVNFLRKNDFIVAHETGHNFGGGHDQITGGNTAPAVAMVNDTGSSWDSFGTVLSYINGTTCPSAKCVKVAYYSNPSLTYRGHDLGVAGSQDNSAQITSQMVNVMLYRARQAEFVGLASYTTHEGRFWTATDYGDVVPHASEPHRNATPWHGDWSTSGYTDIVDIEDNDPWGGYWLVRSDGDVRAIGANHYGDLSAFNLNEPVVAMANRSWNGYWLTAADGGVFAFGAAGYHGSLPEVIPPGLVDNIVDIAVLPNGDGYWLLGADGGVFSFGAAGFYGSLPGIGITNIEATNPAVSFEVIKNGTGYWIVQEEGQVHRFGAAPHRGNTPSLPVGTDVVAIDRYGNSNNFQLLMNDGSVLRCDGAVNCSWISWQVPVVTGIPGSNPICDPAVLPADCDPV